MATVVKQRAALLESLEHVQTALAVFGASSWLRAGAFLHQQASLPVFSGSSALAFNAHVIGHGLTKWGPRGRKRLEYAQAAIAVRYPDGVPDSVTDSKLWRQVRKQLGRDADYCRKFGRDEDGAGKISRQTVARARVIGRAVNS